MLSSLPVVVWSPAKAAPLLRGFVTMSYRLLHPSCRRNSPFVALQGLRRPTHYTGLFPPNLILGNSTKSLFGKGEG
jgi:hypothetical protein